MLRLLTVLALGLFLTLQVAGRDNGQVRLGIQQGRLAAAEAKAKAAEADAPAVTLATFEPTKPATPEPAAAPVPEPVVATMTPEPEPATGPDMVVMYVRSASINVRGGPSTNDDVVGRLTRGDEVQIVAQAADGWVQVRVEGDGVDGFVASRLLTDADPSAN